MNQALLDRLSERPGGTRVKEWISKSKRPISERIKLLQESYGGGSGCSVGNEDGDVFSRAVSMLK